jgi:glycerol-3-phosphate cytidylyltransferase
MAKIRVLFQGSFDIINYGHIKAFKFAKARGDYLIVALNTNALLRKYKGRVGVMPYSHKKGIIEACKYVDEVVPAGNFSPIRLLRKYNIDVFVIAEEWADSKADEIAFMLNKGGEVIIAPRFGGISTSTIKDKLLKERDAQNTANSRANKLRRSGQIAGRNSRGNVRAVPRTKRTNSAVRKRKTRAIGSVILT